MKFKLIIIFLCLMNTNSVPIEIEHEQEEGREPIEGNLEENLPPPGATNNNGNLTVEERMVNVERRLAVQDQKINQVDDQMMYIVGIIFHHLNWSKNNQNNQQSNSQFYNNPTPNQGNPNNSRHQNNESVSNRGNQNGSLTNNQNGNQVRDSNSQNGQQPNNYQGNQSNQSRQQNNQNSALGGSETPNNQPSNSHHSNSHGGQLNNRGNGNSGNMNSNSRTGQGDQALNTPQTQNGNPWQLNSNVPVTNNRGWNQNGGQFNRHGLQDPTNPFRTWHQNNGNINTGSTNQQPRNTNNPNSNTGPLNQQWGQQFNPTLPRRGYFGGGLFSFEQNSMERTMGSMLFNRPMGGTSNGAESFEDYGMRRRGTVFPNGNQNFFGSHRGQGNLQTNNHHQSNSPTDTMTHVGNPSQNSFPTQLTTTLPPKLGQGQNTSNSPPTQSTNKSGPRNVNENADNIDKTMNNNSKSPKMEPPTINSNIPNTRPVEPKNINEDYNNIITDDGFTGKKKGGKQKPFSPISNVPQTGQMHLRNQNGEKRNTHNGKAVGKGEKTWSFNGQVNTNQEHEEALEKEPKEEFGQEEGEAGEGEVEGGSEKEGSEVETQQATMLSNMGESPYEHPPLLLIPSHVDEDND